MHARSRTWAAFYGPRAIRAMVAAFDEAWDVVQFDFHASPESFEAVRLRLADSILMAAASDKRDVPTLRNAGLLAMAMHYRLRPDDFGTRATMPQRLNNPRYWISYAEETRTIAEQMQDPECKRRLLDVAETYAWLARRALAEEQSGRINKAVNE